MESKPFYKSLMIVFNAVVIAGMVIQQVAGSFLISADSQVEIAGAINVLLRLFTSKPIAGIEANR